MRYYEAFIDKYGFSDGDNVPPDADAHRELLVRLFNKRAETVRTPVRCFTYNRPGRHNPCMVLFVRAVAIREIGTNYLHNAEVMSQWVADTDDIAKLLVPPGDSRITRITEWLDNNIELDAGVWTDVAIDTDILKQALKLAGMRNKSQFKRKEKR